jgi:hypothetical protein
MKPVSRDYQGSPLATLIQSISEFIFEFERQKLKLD